MTENRSLTDIRLLATRLAGAQGLEVEHAGKLSREISNADDDIWIAALQWATTGQMPSSPTVEGQDPAQLYARMSPSQVFTALMGLRSDPERALSALKHFPAL